MATGEDLKIVDFSFEYPIGVLRKKKKVEKIVIKVAHGSALKKVIFRGNIPQPSPLNFLKRVVADKYRNVMINWHVEEQSKASPNFCKIIIGSILVWDDKVNGSFTFNHGLGSVCEAVNKILEVNEALASTVGGFSGENRWPMVEYSKEIGDVLLSEFGIEQTLQFVDVFDFSDEALVEITKPVLSVILQFPLTDIFDIEVEKEKEIMAGHTTSNDVYFIQQLIENGSATVSVINALANLKNVNLGNGCLKAFLDETKEKKPDERFASFENSEALRNAHENASMQGSTETLPVGLRSYVGYATFVNVNGTLYELCSKKPFPIAHGPTTEDTFLKNALAICKRYIDREQKNLNFAILALVRGPK